MKNFLKQKITHLKLNTSTSLRKMQQEAMNKHLRCKLHHLHTQAAVSREDHHDLHLNIHAVLEQGYQDVQQPPLPTSSW